MNVLFSQDAWADFSSTKTDSQVKKSLMKQIRDIQRCGESLEGLGHPERLKGNWNNYLSRRLDKKNRLVYRVVYSELLQEEVIVIVTFLGHY